jgi:DNA-binding GntR family transcriptional regulator
MLAGGAVSAAISVARLPAAISFKEMAYAALKEAIVNLDVYGSREPVMLDERELSERLGVSRTPIREALAALHQEGLVRIAPRRGIMVVRKTKAEIVEMVQAWAALESMAARLITLKASDAEIGTLRALFTSFGPEYTPLTHIDEYSSANIAFHQALIRLSGSELLISLTDKIMIHVRAIRHQTIFARERAEHSLNEHMSIIEALEARDTDLAERLARDHTLRLAAYVEKYLNID